MHQTSAGKERQAKHTCNNIVSTANSKRYMYLWFPILKPENLVDLELAVEKHKRKIP